MSEGGRRVSIRTVLIACFLLVAALPIAFLSVQRYVHSVIDNPERARELGAEGVLPKPAPPSTLKARLQRFLDGTPVA